MVFDGVFIHYHLVICYIAMDKPWPIEIDDFPSVC